MIQNAMFAVFVLFVPARGRSGDRGWIIHYCQKGIDRDDRPEDAKHGRNFGNAENTKNERTPWTKEKKQKTKQNKHHRGKYNSAVIRY